MKYSVITFGCRVNQADSLGFEEQLRAAGAAPAPADEADLVVVNTCSVTASADQGARQTIRRVARANPSARIVVTGCYATRQPDEVAVLPNVVRVVNNDAKSELLQIVRSERFAFGPGPCGAPLEPGLAGRTAFTLRVQTGCDEPCSYCIIPATRGAPRSVTPDAVLRDVQRAAASGFKEIALTGVHLGSYGRDLQPQSSLSGLFHLLAREARHGDVLFRVSSLEPMDCTSGIVDLVAADSCFAPHFHLPLQHASNRILAAMRRPYTLEQYAAIVDAIRQRLPHASIGSDIMIGFPGETDDDFARLVSYLEGSPLTHLHVFPYSDRPGTEASRMNGRPAGPVVRARAERVREVSRQLTARFRSSQLGTVRPALTIEDGTLAVTDNYLKVRIPAGLARNTRIEIELAGDSDRLVGFVRAVRADQGPKAAAASR